MTSLPPADGQAPRPAVADPHQGSPAAAAPAVPADPADPGCPGADLAEPTTPACEDSKNAPAVPDGPAGTPAVPPVTGDEPASDTDGPPTASHPHVYHVGVCTVPGCGRIEPMWLTNALASLPAAPPRRFGGALPAPPSAYSHTPDGTDPDRPRPGSGFTFGNKEIALVLSLVLIPILLAPVLVRWVAG